MTNTTATATTYNYLGTKARTDDHVTTATYASMCGAVARGAVGDCTRTGGHAGFHQSATGDAWIDTTTTKSTSVEVNMVLATPHTTDELTATYLPRVTIDSLRVIDVHYNSDGAARVILEPLDDDGCTYVRTYAVGTYVRVLAHA